MLPTDAIVRITVRLARSLLGAAVSVLLFACTPDEPGRVVRDDDKVRYVVHGDAEVSDAAIDRVVAQVVELSALFGVEPRKIEYHFFESRERLYESGSCPVGQPEEGTIPTGCAYTSNSSVSSSLRVHTHELVHLITSQRFGALPSGLHEGLAVLLATSGTPLLDFDRVSALRAYGAEGWLDPTRRLGKGEYSLTAYAHAAQNTRFVLDQLGWEGLLEFAQDASALKTADDVSALVQKHFGRTIDELEADFSAWPRYPSEAQHWVLESAWERLEPGESLTVSSSEVQLVRFEHSATERTVLTLKGGGLFDIVAAGGGMMHPTQIHQLSLDDPTVVALEGPSGSYFLSVPHWDTLIRVSLDRVPLDAPFSTFPMVVLGPGEGASPLYVESDSIVENWAGNMASDDESFITGRPSTFDICRGDNCNTFDGWIDDKPKTIKIEAPGYIVPGTEYPSIFNFAGRVLAAAPASGRFLMYQLHEGE